MEVSSTNSENNMQTGKDPIKKAIEVQEQSVMKILEGMDEQSKEMQKVAAKKTGIGGNINIAG